ncbi:MAG: hypothetical protein JWQ02_3495 [Capsulimonas sp.]|nr:hypothetical protein [Capsulimonas sp.]
MCAVVRTDSGYMPLFYDSIGFLTIGKTTVFMDFSVKRLDCRKRLTKQNEKALCFYKHRAIKSGVTYDLRVAAQLVKFL